MKEAVLVVDDSELIRNIMKNALEEKYMVICAENGKDAIDKISENKDYKFVCMLLDLKMPVYDGFTVLEYFKQFKLFSKIPVYIISGDNTKDTIQKAFTYDIVDMLNKPFSITNIREAVERAINLSKH